MKLFAVITIILSSALFGTAFHTAKAQTSSAPFLCTNSNYSVVRWAEKFAGSSNYSCASSTPTKADVNGSISADSKSVCVTKDSDNPFLGTVYLVRPADGQSCNSYVTSGITVKETPISNIVNSTPTTNTTNTTTTKNQPPTTSTTNKPATPNTKRTPGTTTTSQGNQGSCPDGFVEKGPLCVPNNPFANGGGVAGSGSVAGLALLVINLALGFAGIVAVIMVIVGGYYWMTARGNESQVTNGRKTVINALIGLSIIILSFAIVSIVNSFITKGIS